MEIVYAGTEELDAPFDELARRSLLTFRLLRTEARERMSEDGNDDEIGRVSSLRISRNGLIASRSRRLRNDLVDCLGRRTS